MASAKLFKSYKSKINYTIEQLPVEQQPLFQKALNNPSSNLRYFSPDVKRKGKGIRLISNLKMFNKQDDNGIRIIKNLKKKTENFDEMYRKINLEKKTKSNVLYGKEVDEYKSRGFSDQDLFPTDNIFLPSIILEKTENIRFAIDLLTKEELKKEKDFIVNCNDIMMGIRQGDEGKIIQSERAILIKNTKNEIQSSDMTNKQLDKENRDLIREIQRTSRAVNSISGLPEYCLTTVDTLESDNRRGSNKETQSNTNVDLNQPLKERMNKSTMSKIKNVRYDQNPKKPKLSLSSLYKRVLNNQLSTEYKHILTYLKKKKMLKLQPINFENGSNLNGFLKELQATTRKINIPNKTNVLINKYGSSEIDLKKLNRIQHLDKNIQNLDYDYTNEILYK